MRFRGSKAQRDDSGASAVEYGLIIALVAVVIIAAVTLLGGRLSLLFDNSCTQVASAARVPGC